MSNKELRARKKNKYFWIDERLVILFHQRKSFAREMDRLQKEFKATDNLKLMDLYDDAFKQFRYFEREYLVYVNVLIQEEIDHPTLLD